MRIKTESNVLTITSEINVLDVTNAKKFAPQSLVVRDDKGSSVFRVDTATVPALSPHGVVFNTHDADGNLKVTLIIEGMTPENAQETIESFGVTFAALAKYEAVIVAQVAEALAPIDAIMSTIEIH